MKKFNTVTDTNTIGLDVHDKKTVGVVLCGEGKIIERLILDTNESCFTDCFSDRSGARVVIECGTHSPWISRLIESLGHEVIIANPHEVKLISKSKKKNDKRDAELLARLGRADASLVSPIKHRGEAVSVDRVLFKARNCLVETRTKLINSVRGSVKPFGFRLPYCSAASFPKKAKEFIPQQLKASLDPILDLIEEICAQIKSYENKLAKIAKEKYPETELLTQIPGVGPMTSIAFALTVEDPDRFRNSRDVGSYFGLAPRQHSSGDNDPQLRITKAGDECVRKLLVGAAQYILGVHGPDSDLRRFGERIIEKGGSYPKNRAVVAVARKLAVLMHRLWTDGAVYVPLYNSHKSELIEDCGK
jgi:transposase